MTSVISIAEEEVAEVRPDDAQCTQDAEDSRKLLQVLGMHEGLTGQVYVKR